MNNAFKIPRWDSGGKVINSPFSSINIDRAYLNNVKIIRNLTSKIIVINSNQLPLMTTVITVIYYYYVYLGKVPVCLNKQI